MIVTGLIALLCVVWGSTWLVIKWGLETTPPLTGACARFGLAFVVLYVVGGHLSRREGGARPGWDLVLVNGIGQFVINYSIVYWAQQTLPSGLVSVLWSVFPLMVAGLGHFMLKSERISTRQWVGFCLAFVGVAVLFQTDLENLSADAVPTGLVLLVSPAVVAWVTLYLKRHGRDVSSVMLARDSMGIGAIGLAVLAFVFERERPAVWSGAAFGAIAYLAIVGSCLTFGVYLWLLRWVAAYKLSLISYVSPALALVLGASLGGEPITMMTLVGSGIILLGVAAASRRARTH